MKRAETRFQKKMIFLGSVTWKYSNDSNNPYSRFSDTRLHHPGPCSGDVTAHPCRLCHHSYPADQPFEPRYGGHWWRLKSFFRLLYHQISWNIEFSTVLLDFSPGKLDWVLVLERSFEWIQNQKVSQWSYLDAQVGPDQFNLYPWAWPPVPPWDRPLLPVPVRPSHSGLQSPPPLSIRGRHQLLTIQTQLGKLWKNWHLTLPQE